VKRAYESLPPEPRNVRFFDDIRKLAHSKLDEILDMYEQGVPLWIIGEVVWSASRENTSLSMTIKENM
jgi:hypothetical protein